MSTELIFTWSVCSQDRTEIPPTAIYLTAFFGILVHHLLQFLIFLLNTAQLYSNIFISGTQEVHHLGFHFSSVLPTVHISIVYNYIETVCILTDPYLSSFDILFHSWIEIYLSLFIIPTCISLKKQAWRDYFKINPVVVFQSIWLLSSQSCT